MCFTVHELHRLQHRRCQYLKYLTDTESYFIFAAETCRLQPTMPSLGGVIECTIVLISMSGMVVFKLNHSADFLIEIRHLDNNLIHTKVPRGYPHPCPGSLFRLSCMLARAEL